MKKYGVTVKVNKKELGQAARRGAKTVAKSVVPGAALATSKPVQVALKGAATAVAKEYGHRFKNMKPMFPVGRKRK